MKYDFSKCNNLRWKFDDKEGFCKVYTETDGKGRIAFVRDDRDFDGSHYVYGTAALDANYNEELYISKVRILPRSPRTYKDWQVGDKVKIVDNDLETVIEVGARMNNIVICFNSRGYWGTYTCDELFDRGELVLTDYERTLIPVPKYVFNQGDKVLARFGKNGNDEEDKVWCYGKYYGANDSDTFPYSVTAESGTTYNYCECIPYNENTWHLLGTKEDYND